MSLQAGLPFRFAKDSCAPSGRIVLDGLPTGGVARKRRGLCRRLYSVNPSGFWRMCGRCAGEKWLKKSEFTIPYTRCDWLDRQLDFDDREPDPSSLVVRI